MKKAPLFTLILSATLLSATCLDIGGLKLNTTSQLMWSQQATSNFTYTNAKLYCSNLDEGTYDDWVLPNINELSTEIITDGNNAICFSPDRHWSATSYATDGTKAYVTYNNRVRTNTKVTTRKVRCVRPAN